MTDLTEEQGIAADLGYQIAQAREKLGLTVDAAAEATRMRKAYVSAIEAGALAQLPGEPYTRAYIRRYAEFLKLDMDTIIVEYAGSATLEPRKLFVLPEILSAQTQTHANGRMALTAFLIAMLCVALWNMMHPSIIAPQVMPLVELEAVPTHILSHRCTQRQPVYPPCRWENTGLWYKPIQPDYYLFAPHHETTP